MMNSNQLTERYIYAVTRRLPAAVREDVAQELRGLIADMQEERAQGGEPTAENLREVLLELGNPHELAAKYHPQPGGLIPQPYYSYYLTVLPIVVAIGCSGVAIALILSAAIDPSSIWPQAGVDNYTAVGYIISHIVGGVFDVGVQTFMWVTVIFAILARKQADLGKGEDFLGNLPELPQNRKPLRRASAIAGIAVGAFIPAILILSPGVICIIHDGLYSPVFDSEKMRQLWWAFIGMGIAGIAGSCAEMIEGYRTRRLLIATLCCNVIFAACAIAWLGSPAILSTGYLNIMASMVDGVALTMMQNLNYVVLGGILLGIAIDTGESIYATLRS